MCTLLLPLQVIVLARMEVTRVEQLHITGGQRFGAKCASVVPKMRYLTIEWRLRFGRKRVYPNVPLIPDVLTMIEVLRSLGMEVSWEEEAVLDQTQERSEFCCPG